MICAATAILKGNRWYFKQTCQKYPQFSWIVYSENKNNITEFT